jgi:hypothetical protein
MNRTSIFLFALVLLVVGCDGGKGKKPERNVIKEYVNTPKDRANAVKNKLEGAQQNVHDQYKTLSDEE